MEKDTRHTSHHSASKTKVLSKIDISCPDCNAPIDGTQININSSLAKCKECGSVFQIRDDAFFLSDRPHRPEMIMPPGTDVLELPSSLDIRIDWLKSHPAGALGFLTFFAALWNGILLVIAFGMISAGNFGALSFLAIHGAVGLGLAYYLSRIYLNYTDIIVTDDEIEIQEQPIPNPFTPPKSIDRDQIDQLYVTKYVSSTTNGIPSYAYALYAILKNGKKLQLIKGMNKETQLYLEQKIERFLDIKDRLVPESITE